MSAGALAIFPGLLVITAGLASGSIDRRGRPTGRRLSCRLGSVLVSGCRSIRGKTRTVCRRPTISVCLVPRISVCRSLKGRRSHSNFGKRPRHWHFFLILRIILFMLAIQLLHLLVHMRTVKNIGTLHSLTVALDFGRIVVHLRTEIPQFKNMKALLGTNGDTDNGVLRIGRNQT